VRLSHVLFIAASCCSRVYVVCIFRFYFDLWLIAVDEATETKWPSVMQENVDKSFVTWEFVSKYSENKQFVFFSQIAYITIFGKKFWSQMKLLSMVQYKFIEYILPHKWLLPSIIAKSSCVPMGFCPIQHRTKVILTWEKDCWRRGLCRFCYEWILVQISDTFYAQSKLLWRSLLLSDVLCICILLCRKASTCSFLLEHRRSFQSDFDVIVRECMRIWLLRSTFTIFVSLNFAANWLILLP